jgi:hypothetical protein
MTSKNNPLSLSEIEYLVRLARRRDSYQRRLIGALKKENLVLINLISALMAIETTNRRIIWRLSEYILLLFEVLYFGKLSCCYTNSSIGHFQMKIATILRRLDIPFELRRKTIVSSRYLSIRDVVRVIRSANDPNLLAWHLMTHFSPAILDHPSMDELNRFALEYSGNKSFDGPLNYFSALQYLLNQTPRSSYKTHGH